MYGLVKEAIEDLVVSTSGREVWNRIKAQANVGNAEYPDAMNFDDEATYSLIISASAELGRPAEQVLYEFGRHWIHYTGAQGWDSIFSIGGACMKDFMTDLEKMRARVEVVMPQASLPDIKVRQHPEYLEVVYHSRQEGLAPIVEGMLGGFAERFNEHWEVKRSSASSKIGLDIFNLKQVDAPCTTGVMANAA